MKFKLLYLLLLTLPVLASSCNQAPLSPVPLSGQLSLYVAYQVKAGASLRVEVTPANTSERVGGIAVTLVAMGSYGPHIHQTTFKHGNALFLLPSQEMQQSGQLRLVAISGAARGYASVMVEPGNAVEPLVPLIGARSIIADDYHWSMAVVVPSDAFGNPVTDGTTIQVSILYPDDNLETRSMTTKNLLAWMRILSSTKAGRTVIAVQIGNAHGPEGVLLQTAGWPVPFQIFFEPTSVPADGHQLVTLYTSSIQDKFGNIVPDGTLITFVVSYPNGQITIIPANTIGGVAQTVLQAPQQPGNLMIYAVILGAESLPLQISFSPGLALGSFPIVIHREASNQGYTLTIGPLLGTMGQFIPDGTPVYFQLTRPHSESFSLDSVSQNGYASAEVRTASYPPGTYTITALVGSSSATATLTLP